MSLILMFEKPFYQIVVTGTNSATTYCELIQKDLPNCLFAWLTAKSNMPLLNSHPLKSQ
jgi:hypothetical protein